MVPEACIKSLQLRAARPSSFGAIYAVLRRLFAQGVAFRLQQLLAGVQDVPEKLSGYFRLAPLFVFARQLRNQRHG